MRIEGQYIDEVLRALYERLDASTDVFEASKGKGRDLLAPTVVLKNPRARISATVTRGRLISALGEFCWYMSGAADLEFMRYYLPNYPPKEKNGELEEAYGPRLVGSGQFGFKTDQIERVIERLTLKPDTRRAVISILNPDDLALDRDEAPCTVALQFVRRRGRIHLIVLMRSNDAYLGFPHDVFCFTMMQEYVARALGARVGEYHHFATSLHLYEDDRDDVARYLGEGFQSPTFAMPKMPNGCQKKNLSAFLEVENAIRNGTIADASEIQLPNYWRDLAIVLLRHADTKFKRGKSILESNFSKISDQFYKSYFTRRTPTIMAAPIGMYKQEKLELGDDGAGTH